MSAPPSKRRRVELTLADRVNLIKESEAVPKPTLVVLGQKYGIGKSTVSDIIKKKASYLEQWENNSDSKKQRANSCKYDSLNDLVWQWFTRIRSKNLPISGVLIQEKAIEYAKELDLGEFKASNGWLEKWKARYSIKGFKLCGESAGVNQDCIGWITQSWKDIKTTTIERCFKKAGFCSCQADSEDTPENDDDDEEDDDVPLSVLVRQFALQADELVNIDNNLETEDTADNWEKELLSAYKPAPSVDQDDSDVSDTEPDTDTLPGSDMSHREVLELATKLKNFATNKDSSFLEIAQKLQTMTEKEIVKQKCCERQSTITSFFVKQ